MIAELSPAFIVIFGALLIPLVPQIGQLRNIYMLALPIFGCLQLLLHPMVTTARCSSSTTP